MVRSGILAACLTLALASSASAQTASLASYCSAERGFGQTFNANRVERPGRVVNGLGNRIAFEPRDAFPPFTRFEAGFSPKTHQLHGTQGMALFASQSEAQAAFNAIVAELSAVTSFAETEISEPDVSPSGGIWRTAKFYEANAHSDDEAPSGLRIAIYMNASVSNGATVAMDCINAELYRRAEREALSD